MYLLYPWLKKMNELGITILRFSDELVLKDMENVMRAVEFIFVSMKNTPQPLKRGVRRARKTCCFNFKTVIYLLV
jgi:hypothetical protein